MSRKKVLLVAEAANPEWVSVPLIGWSVAKALKDVADVHLVTQIRNKSAIERAGWIAGEDFTAIDSEPIARRIDRFANLFGVNRAWTVRTALDTFSHAYFERKVWQAFSNALSEGSFDIVHRVTPVSPAISSSLASRCRAIDVKFVVGPLNGGVPWPAGFKSEQNREREWLSNLRNAYKLMPARGRMLRDANVVLAGSRFAMNEIPAKYRYKTVYLPENCIDPERFRSRAKQDGQLPLRVCFIGRLVPLKGVDMLMHAAADLMRDGKLVLEIIGDGPMRQPFEVLAAALGIKPYLTFHGNLPHDQVGVVASRNHMLAFPSIREFGGGVVLEAMAMGVVPAVVDYAGPAELVDAETGYKVPIGTREEIIAGFNTLLNQIVTDPAQLKPKSHAAMKLVRDRFTWPQKAQQFLRLYDWVLNNNTNKPVLVPIPIGNGSDVISQNE